jgi:3,4-dihydroxy 2-butanone 4-phosphate synthase/GTP cyclohydrolase II
VNEGLSRAVYAEGKGFLSPIAEILEDLRNGRMIILVDAEDRENEGDLVIPAQMATPTPSTSWPSMVRGLICLSLTQQRAGQLPPRIHGTAKRGTESDGVYRLHRGP